MFNTKERQENFLKYRSWEISQVQLPTKFATYNSCSADFWEFLAVAGATEWRGALSTGIAQTSTRYQIDSMQWL